MLSPAWPESRSFLNISTPVTTRLVGRYTYYLYFFAYLYLAALDSAGSRRCRGL